MRFMCLSTLLAVSEDKRRLGWLASGCAPVMSVILGLMFVVCVSTTNAQEQTVWQIGKHDNGSLEFNQTWDFSQGRDPVLIIPESDPKKDWSHFQPGSGNLQYGERVHPFAIQFDLNHTPRGTFYLVVDLFFKEPLVPVLAVDINGKKGEYRLHPTLSYELGDPEMFDDIIPSIQHLRIPLPASFFHQGKNTLVLSCVGESGSTIHPVESKVGSPSGIYYDDLKLSNDPAARYDEKYLHAEAHPTIFYHQGKNDQLKEVILLNSETGGRFESGTATLGLGGEKYSCDLPGGRDFGESECAVEVREFTGASSGKLTVRLGKAARSFEVSLTPQKKWKLFEVPQNHIDAGYTDYRPKAYEVHNRNLDQAVEAIESHPWYKFNLDGSFDLEQYWLHRDQVRQDSVVQALKNDRIGLPALSFTLDTGLASQEELYRLGYYSQSLGRRYGIPVEYANQTDLPAHGWALPSFLSAQGIKYLNIASDPYRGPILYYGRLNEKSPFWWEGPDGSKILTWYSWDYIQMGFLFGFADFGMKQLVLQAGVTSLPIFLQPYGSSSYAADAVMIFGNVSDNRPFNPYDVEFSQKWNSEFAYPKIIVATVPDFFHYMEHNFASSFTTLRGDGGATWEEMIAADAQHGAIVRHTAERVVAAEASASLGVIANKDFKFPMDEDHDIWGNLLLYMEHSWGGIGRTWRHPDEQLVNNLFRSKQAFSTQAEIQVDVLLRRGLDQLTSRISAQGDMLLVFNALSWERGGMVEVDLPRGSNLTDLQTKQPVPAELVRRAEDEDYDRVCFWAEGIPSLGYRGYAISTASLATPTPTSELGDSNRGVIENQYYKITVDPSRGGIASIYDKQLGRELVDQKSPYALDQYVYAGYGHEGVSNFRQRTEFNSTVLQYGPSLPSQELQVSTGGEVKIVGVKKTSWGTELTLESSAAHTPRIETDILLFDQVKRIELVNRVHKEVVRAPEAVYFAFPFLGQNPTVRYEIQNGWVDPSRDMLPGANTEWFAAQHWVAVTDAEHTVGLALNEAPLLTIGDIVRGHWPKSLEHDDGTIFSYVMNNYDGDDDLPYQGGDFTFHYALTSEKEFNPAGLTRFSLEADNPLEQNYVRMGFDRHEPSAEALKAESSSFISISGGQVILSTWKAAEDGKGYILRFYNTTDQPAEAQVGFPHLVFDRVNRCNAAEVDQAEVEAQQGEVKISLGPHEIGTYRVTGFGLRP
jgi:hypothetical protein